MSADTNKILDELGAQFDERLKQRRAVLLGIFEGLLGHTEHWQIFRQQLLKFFGNSGVRGDFYEILEALRRSGSDVDSDRDREPNQ